VGSFIDRHLAEAVSDEAFSRALLEADEHKVDAYGVLVLGHWLASGRLYCVLEASDAQAVREQHAALGLPCDDLREVEALSVTWPLSAEDDARVRASIAAAWG
jgi:Protein of unknown function (DUF4242)